MQVNRASPTSTTSRPSVSRNDAAKRVAADVPNAAAPTASPPPTAGAAAPDRAPASVETVKAGREAARAADLAARNRIDDTAIPGKSPDAGNGNAPPTVSELGIDTNTIGGKARAAELEKVVDHYSQSDIRSDVRDRVFSDVRNNPNLLTTLSTFIDDAAPPTPLGKEGKLTGAVIDSLFDRMIKSSGKGR